MEKLTKRVAQAELQASRRATRVGIQRGASGRVQDRFTLINASKEVREDLKAARIARRERWEMGPLAPKRELGFNGYGAASDPLRQDFNYEGRGKIHASVLEKRCAWAGGSQRINLAAKDRVVILDGPDKGKVDIVKEILPDSGAVRLMTCHQMFFQQDFAKSGQVTAGCLPISSVRLVYPLRNPATGVTRDVIINELKSSTVNMDSETMTYERWEYGKRWDRIVPALNISIPWPEIEAPEQKTHEADTTRKPVEDRSFHFNLINPPMPMQVIDELRNKYSKFRTRHDAEYIQKKIAEHEAKKGRAEMIKAMQTPWDELQEKKRASREADGEPELTEEMLIRIGQIMARSKAEALDLAGATEVSQSSDAAPSNLETPPRP